MFGFLVRKKCIKTQSLIDAINLYGVIIIDQNSIMTHCNQKMCDITGYSMDKLRNQSLLKLIPAHYHNAHINGIQRIVDGTSEEKLLNKKDAFTVPILNHESNEINVGLRIRQLEGNKLSFIGFIQKVTDNDQDCAHEKAVKRRSLIEEPDIDNKNMYCNVQFLETVYHKLPTELSKLSKQILDVQLYTNEHFISLFQSVLILTRGTNDVKISSSNSLVNVMVSCHVKQLFSLLETVMKKASSVCKITMYGMKTTAETETTDKIYKYVEFDISCAMFTKMPDESNIHGLTQPLYLIKRICIMIEADIIVTDNNMILKLPYKYSPVPVSTMATCEYCQNY
jgi:PAS domain S-box-containing protein